MVIATNIKEENLYLAHYSHFKPALEAKHNARICSTYFENNKLKDETKEQTTQVTTAKSFLKASAIDHA